MKYLMAKLFCMSIAYAYMFILTVFQVVQRDSITLFGHIIIPIAVFACMLFVVKINEEMNRIKSVGGRI